LNVRGVTETAGSLASAFPLSHSPRLFISLAVTELREKITDSFDRFAGYSYPEGVKEVLR